MLFNSIEFAIFLPVVFILYWYVFNKNLRIQNFFILAVSYLFYGWWDWRFLSLLAFSSFVDYLIGLQFLKFETPGKRKILLAFSLFINLGLLGFFKYYNFFIQNFIEAFTFLGHKPNIHTLKIILPVGISFYTFQTLSYNIDVYRKKLAPTRDIISFFAFVSFFPQLVAGPIERATALLPQFQQPRIFNYSKAVDGLRQILWGLFKKMVIADNCAEYVEEIFSRYSIYPGSTLLIAIFLFAIQIYCDFSGYSDMAIGIGRLFGFSLMRNFAFPYFSRDIAEFWRRWHISLSTWFRDYVYVPLGGSKGNKFTVIRNTLIVFVVSGFWHGANWTFIVWGALNALYFVPLVLMNKNRVHLNTVAEGKLLPSFKEFVQMTFTFFLTLIAWVFFRANTLTEAMGYLGALFNFTLFSTPELIPWRTLAAVALLLTIEWLQREKQHALEAGGLNIPQPLRWGFYIMISFIILIFGGKEQVFIYFQF